MDEQAAIAADPRYRAADRALITDGARMYNYYDCEWVTVQFGDGNNWANPTSEFHSLWDGWFTCRRESGGTVLLNGERLAGKKPAWMEEKK